MYSSLDLFLACTLVLRAPNVISYHKNDALTKRWWAQDNSSFFLRIHTGIEQLDIHIRCNPSPYSPSSDLIKTPMNMLFKAPQCYHVQSSESRRHCGLHDYAKYMSIHLFMSLLSQRIYTTLPTSRGVLSHRSPMQALSTSRRS